MRRIRWKNFLRIGVVLTIVLGSIFTFLAVRKGLEYKPGDTARDGNLFYEIKSRESILNENEYVISSSFKNQSLFAVLKVGQNYNSKVLSIPSRVRNVNCIIIPNEMFSGNESIEKVYFLGRTIIGERAFENCTNLKEVGFYEVTYTGVRSFNNCTKLANIVMNIDVGIGCVYLADGVFRKCSSLKNVDVRAMEYENADNKAFESPFAYCNLEKIVYKDESSTNVLANYKLVDDMLYYNGNLIYYSPDRTVLNYDKFAKINNIIGCNDNISEININSMHKEYVSIAGAIYTKDGRDLIAYPNAKETITFLETIENIEEGAFAGTFKCTNVVVPYGVNVKDNAFYKTNIQISFN